MNGTRTYKLVYFYLILFSVVSHITYASEREIALSPSLPRLECGSYRAQGVLVQNNLGQFVLLLQGKSMASSELILMGGSIEMRRSFLGTPVVVEFYVPQPFKGTERPLVYLQNMEGVTKEARHSWVKYIRERSCHEWERFINPSLNGDGT